jgi:hypothetical protein
MNFKATLIVVGFSIQDSEWNQIKDCDEKVDVSSKKSIMVLNMHVQRIGSRGNTLKMQTRS